jgi:hypothetical protein
MSKWDTIYEEDIVRDHIEHVVQALCDLLNEHYGIQPNFYSHSEFVQFGDEEVQAPAIVLTGPITEQSDCLGDSPVWVKAGNDEAGHEKSRKYHRIEYWDLTFETLFVTNDPYSLMRLIESSSVFFRSNGFLVADTRTYRIRRLTNVSTENVVNFSNTPMASGTLCIKSVMLVSPYDTIKSGRVYQINESVHSMEERAL